MFDLSRRRLKIVTSRCAMRIAFLLLSLTVNCYSTADSQNIAPTPTPTPTQTEQWVIDKLTKGEIADLNENCNTDKLKPKLDKDIEKWQAPCRQLDASFVADLLTKERRIGAISHQGVRLKGARITGKIDLESTSLHKAFEVYDSKLEGEINLRFAETDKVMQFGGSQIRGVVDAGGFRAKSDFDFTNVSVRERGRKELFRQKDIIILRDAHIDGNVKFGGARIWRKIEAANLSVGGDLNLAAMELPAEFGAIDLGQAKVTGQLLGYGSHFHRQFLADSLHVGGSVLLGYASYANHQYSARFDDNVSIQFARIEGLLDLSTSAFYGDVTVTTSDIHGKLTLEDAVFSDEHILSLSLTHIAGDLLIGGAKLSALDLSGVSVGGNFTLGLSSSKPPRMTTWMTNNCACEYRRQAEFAEIKKVKGLDLRNAHVGGLIDREPAWPPQCQLYLDGFSFDHLGGRTGETSQKMNRRGEWWDTNWARLDSDFSPTPYLQLASAFTASGNRDAANEIRYLEKSREQEKSHGLTWLVAVALKCFAGFGIGNYSFVALGWALVVSVFGALYLRVRCRPASESREGPRHWIWYFGASLSRLLPIVEINKEFTDYFDDSKHKNLYPDQVVFFDIVAVFGFVLGGVVAAALAGLLQNP